MIPSEDGPVISSPPAILKNSPSAMDHGTSANLTQPIINHNIQVKKSHGTEDSKLETSSSDPYDAVVSGRSNNPDNIKESTESEIEKLSTVNDATKSMGPSQLIDVNSQTSQPQVKKSEEYKEKAYPSLNNQPQPLESNKQKDSVSPLSSKPQPDKKSGKPDTLVNRIVVETETVDSSPSISLSSYDKSNQNSNSGIQSKHQFMDESSSKKESHKSDEPNMAGATSATANDSFNNNSAIFGATNLSTNPVALENYSGNNNTNQNISTTTTTNNNIPNNPPSVVTTTTTTTTSIPEMTLNNNLDLKSRVFSTSTIGDKVPKIEPNGAELVDSNAIVDHPDDELNDHKSASQTASHNAYSRSLRNKRSILMDSSANVTSNASLASKNVNVASQTTNVPNVNMANPNVPQNNVVSANYLDDDTRSITSSIKRSKPKPKLKKISSSRADIFEAQVEGALDDEEHSDGNETFVYESRGHSRDNSANTIELEASDGPNNYNNNNNDTDTVVDSKIEGPIDEESEETDSRNQADHPYHDHSGSASVNDNISNNDIFIDRKFSAQIQDPTEHFKLEKSSLRGIPRVVGNPNNNSQAYNPLGFAIDQEVLNTPSRGTKYSKQGKAYKKSRLTSRGNYDDCEEYTNNGDIFSNDSHYKGTKHTIEPSIGSSSMKDFYLNSNSGMTGPSEEKDYVDDQGSVHHYHFNGKYGGKGNNNNNNSRYNGSNLVRAPSKSRVTDPYQYQMSSSHENTSDSELEYTTDDFTYPKFTRYRKNPPSKYTNIHGDTHVLNRQVSIPENLTGESNHSTLTSGTTVPKKTGEVNARFISRNSSISNFDVTKAKAPPIHENNMNQFAKPKRGSSVSPVVNYHPHTFRRFSSRSKNRHQHLQQPSTPQQLHLQSQQPQQPSVAQQQQPPSFTIEESPSKNYQSINGGRVVANGRSVSTANTVKQYNSYSKPQMPNQLRTTISKLFDPQGTNLKRYSGVPDDFTVDDFEDENFDDDVNYFGYDLEDGSEINESTPLNFDYYNSYSRSPKLRNMNSLEDAKMNAYRHSRLVGKDQDQSIPYYNTPNAYYTVRGKKSYIQMIQSTFWGILLMVSFLSLGFFCGFFLASTKDLADVSIVDMNHLLVSTDELIFDIECDGINPGFTTIVLEDVDLDLFVKTRYLENDDDDDDNDGYDRLFHYQTFFIGNIKGLEYPMNFPSNMFDKKKVHATSSIRLIDPGKNNSDPTYNDGLQSNPEQIDTTKQLDILNSEHLTFSSETPTSRQKMWKVAIKYPFELIVRGKFNYKLPFGNSRKAIAVHKSISADPAQNFEHVAIEG
ncbi:Vac7 protein [Saccharomycopsis crataegensis]|uniref:Vac7 protein n=1 Tax=Saccharomycopsis crataegensis TaxID=43959 RepID=A0AAV5QRZ2_9ASCO|nr:Vac7 protein [Saccharomycopsis crataegensis]